MKRVFLITGLVAMIVAASAVVSPSFAGGNLLVNPGFEANGGSYDGWLTFGSGVQLSLPAGDNIIRSGSAASKIYGEFTGCPPPNFDVGGYGQSFTPTPGLVYKFSGFHFVSSGDPMTGTDICNENRCLAKVVFFDAAVGGNELGSNEVIIGAGYTPTDQWMEFSVSAPAPVGALRVEALILFLQPGCATGTVFVDDTSLYELEEVPRPNILANPSFDTDLSGWDTFGNVYHDARSFFYRTSTGTAKLFGPFSGPGGASTMSQSFPAVPGSYWRLDAFSLNNCREDAITGTNDNLAVAKIAFLDANGTEIGSNETTITDNTAPLGTWTRHTVVANAPSGTDSVAAYIIFVQPTNMGGAVWVDDVSLAEINDPTGVPDASGSLAFELHQNVPNPFNPTTRIRFDLMQPDAVNIGVYDVAGRRIATLLDGKLGAGPHTVTWNGRATDGSPVATGIYWYVLKTSTGQMSRSMVLIK